MSQPENYPKDGAGTPDAKPSTETSLNENLVDAVGKVNTVPPLPRKQPTSSTDPSIVESDGLTINLKNRHFAALLGLAFPGAGHYYQGRKHKSLLFAICILGLFATGLFLGNGRVVYMSWKPEDYRLQFPAQMCVGIPALPAILHANAHADRNLANTRGRSTLDPPRPLTWRTFMAPPEDTIELSRWHYQSSAGFELGTLMTAVAGLLNILAVFDALAGPIAPAPAGKRKEENA